MRAARVWIWGFLGVVALVGFGRLEAWPFSSWDMFSAPEPSVNRVARVVAVTAEGVEKPLGSDTLPLGLLGHPLRSRLDRADPADRVRICDALLSAGRSAGGVVEVRVEVRSWDPLERAGDRPADVRTDIVAVCR